MRMDDTAFADFIQSTGLKTASDVATKAGVTD